MATYFIETNQISEIQWGFKAGDLRVNQLLDITYQIFSSLHDNYEIRGYSLTFQKLS